MKELTLKDIQDFSLNILIDVHEFCVANNITYSLAYGTLIGAIRHKGFIPWDDDVDIIMPRSDFEKFCKEYHSNKGYKVMPADSNDNYLMFARVYDTQKTIVKSEHPWTKLESGLWIDVFPIDGVDEKESLFIDKVERLRKINKYIFIIRTSALPLWEQKTIRKKFTWGIKRIVGLWYSNRRLKSMYNKELQRMPLEKALYWGQLSCFDEGTLKEHNPKEDFLHTIEVEFEGYTFYAINGYDNVLRRYYGDYMQLPPLEKQVPKQESYLKYYWK